MFYKIASFPWVGAEGWPIEARVKEVTNPRDKMFGASRKALTARQ